MRGGAKFRVSFACALLLFQCALSHDGEKIAKHAADDAADGAEHTVKVADKTSHQAVDCVSKGSLKGSAECAGKDAATDGADEAEHTAKKDEHEASVAGHMSMDVVKHHRRLAVSENSSENSSEILSESSPKSDFFKDERAVGSVRDAISKVANISTDRVEIAQWEEVPLRADPDAVAERRLDDDNAGGSIELDYLVKGLNGTEAEELRRSLSECELEELTAEIAAGLERRGASADYTVLVTNHTASVVFDVYEGGSAKRALAGGFGPFDVFVAILVVVCLALAAYYHSTCCCPSGSLKRSTRGAKLRQVQTGEDDDDEPEPRAGDRSSASPAALQPAQPPAQLAQPRQLAQPPGQVMPATPGLTRVQSNPASPIILQPQQFQQQSFSTMPTYVRASPSYSAVPNSPAPAWSYPTPTLVTSPSQS